MHLSLIREGASDWISPDFRSPGEVRLYTEQCAVTR